MYENPNYKNIWFQQGKLHNLKLDGHADALFLIESKRIWNTQIYVEETLSCTILPSL